MACSGNKCCLRVVIEETEVEQVIVTLYKTPKFNKYA